MFLDLDKKDRKCVAIVDNQGWHVTYGDLCEFVEEFYSAVKQRCIVAVLTENCVGACAGYLAAMSNHIVPLMLSYTLDKGAINSFVEIYQIPFLWAPKGAEQIFEYPVCLEKYGYVLFNTRKQPRPMAENLSLLLPTSGSTGSPKLVRHSYENVEANARAVAKIFELDHTSCGMESLPLNFTQGLNVASSHLFAGGKILLTKDALMQKSFWTFFKEQGAESFTGVPYSYEVLNRLGFFRMDLPNLKVLNQGGGRMPDSLFETCAKYAEETGRKFIATYGATETTSRMAYLPSELAMKKKGSIGRPLPGCSIILRDDDGNEITSAGTVGEIVFQGPNVTLGYAESVEDLLQGDHRNGVYPTGDMAWRDEDGCYYIVGRRSRFVKLFGFRVGLDETERLLKSELSLNCACVGDDKQLRIYVEESNQEQEIWRLLRSRTNIPHTAFCVIHIDNIPKNDAGKTMYSMLS